VSIDEQHVALPTLYGAPAYARPPARVERTPRPFDPDELPLEVHRTEEERLMAAMPPGSGDGDDTSVGGRSETGSGPLDLRRISRRLIGRA
jgi:hypothetical protein